MVLNVKGRLDPHSLDIAETLVNEIDRIKKSIGVDRSALIKIWLHERIQREKALSRDI